MKDLALRVLINGKWQVPGRNVVIPSDPPPPPPDPTDPNPPPPPAPTVRTLLDTDWESAPLGALNTTAGLAAFRAGLGDSNVAGTSNLANASIATDGTGKGKFYRQSFAASTGDGLAVFADGPFTGLQITEATITLELRFNGGLGRGAKIPGLGGVNSSAASPSEVTGGKIPISDNGWSGRHMVLTPGSGETNTNPDFANYMYPPRISGDQYGDDFLFGTGPAIGTWYTLVTRYKLNTPGQANGILNSTWNGVTKTNRTNHDYRTKSDVFFSHIYWAIFWGGADKAAWAPTVASSIDIARIKITTPGA